MTDLGTSLKVGIIIVTGSNNETQTGPEKISEHMRLGLYGNNKDCLGPASTFYKCVTQQCKHRYLAFSTTKCLPSIISRVLPSYFSSLPLSFSIPPSGYGLAPYSSSILLFSASSNTILTLNYTPSPKRGSKLHTLASEMANKGMWCAGR